MESREVVVIGSGPAALRAAIACSDAGVVPLVIDELGIGSGSGAPPVAGLAASIDELNSQSHMEDTLAAGGEFCNESVVSRTCNEGVPTLAELERWGLALRRRDGGLPHTAPAPGHQVPRLTGCGDSTIREVTRILEEQAIKRDIQRNADYLPLSIVSDNNQVRGLVTLNISTGEIEPFQTKAVILATEGHQGLWSNPNEGAGTGAALAISAGIELRGMGRTPRHPLTIRDCSIHIPMDVLGSGGRIRRENGDDIGPEEALEGEPCVLDLRGLDPDARSWFSQTSLRIRDRLGLDITRDVIPLSPGVAYTIGGAPCDQEGRVIFEGQNTGDESTSLWHTGLYAAGRSANTGMHGASPLPGNILLDDLVSGKAAGAHAATWAPINHFGGSDRIEQAVQEASNLISSIREGEGMTVGNFASKLSSAISTGPSSMEAAIAEIHDIKDSGIRLTDTSKVMNTEMVEALRLHGLASVAESIIASG
jgi:succinate dehydrogenase/fumarate reductase flavoprotein subunit|tara:strand:- start:11879 stop:13318 length:1440 start_codon:yes stop_codon:yes gene_type:complete